MWHETNIVGLHLTSMNIRISNLIYVELFVSLTDKY